MAEVSESDNLLHELQAALKSQDIDVKALRDRVRRGLPPLPPPPLPGPP